MCAGGQARTDSERCSYPEFRRDLGLSPDDWPSHKQVWWQPNMATRMRHVCNEAQTSNVQCSASLPLPTRTSNHEPSPLAYTTKDVEEKPQGCTQIARERRSGCIHMSFGCDLINFQHSSQAPSPAPSSASGRSAFSKGKDKLKRMFRRGIGKEVRRACE